MFIIFILFNMFLYVNGKYVLYKSIISGNFKWISSFMNTLAATYDLIIAYEK